MRKRQYKYWLIMGCFLTVLCVLVLWIKGFPAKEGIWTSDSWNMRASESNAEQSVAVGPFLNLGPGNYRLQWQIDLEEDSYVEIRLLSTNGVAVDPAVIVLTDENAWSEIWFEIPDAVQNFCANVYRISGSEPVVHALRLTSPRYKDHVYSIAFILFGGLMIGWLAAYGVLKKEWEAIVILATAVVIASTPMFGNALPDGGDIRFHLSRLVNLADGLKTLELPVRIGSFSYNRYGAVTSIFYPDLFLVPFALMLLSGASLTYTVQTFFVFGNILLAILSYISSRWMMKNKLAALCTAVFFVLCVKRVSDIYSATRIGGNIAACFIPVFYAALYEVLLGEYRRWPYLVIGAFGIFESHIMTTFLTGLFAVAYIIMNLPVIIKEKERRKAMTLAIVLTVGVCASTLVPLAECLLSGNYTGVVQYGFSQMVLPLNVILDKETLGYLLILGTVLFLLQVNQPKGLKQFLVLGIIGVLLSSVLFPWTIIERIFGTFMTVVQFPERFLMMGVFFLTICSGWAAGEYLKDKNRGAFLALILAVLLIIPALESIGERPTTMFTGEWAPSLMDTPEYQLQGTDLSLIRERTVESNPSVVVSKYERFGTGARGHLQAYEQGTVVLPIFAFDQYQLHIGDQKVSYVRGNNNRVTFNVQAGTDTDFVLLYCIPLRWRCADAISVLSLLVLIWKACSVGRSKRYPYHETGYNSIEA